MFRKISNIELNRPSSDEYKNRSKLPISIILDNIRSQHNIGSSFRTSDAFLVEKIYICGISSTPPSPEIHKSALGAEFTVAWEYYKNTIEIVEKLKKEGYTIISVEQTESSTSLEKFSLDETKKYAIIFGNEVKGVQQEVANISDITLEIPQFGTKHSLNVSVSIGIVLWSILSPSLTR